MKGFFKEFGAFIRRGNVIDLAVGMIIGTAFNKIVSSLVNDIIMPAVGSLLNVNITDAKVTLVQEVLDSEGEIVTPAVTLNYGQFIQTIIDFLIIAFSVFVIVKVITGLRNRAEAAKKKKEEEAAALEAAEAPQESVEEVAPAPTTNELLSEIVELLKKDKEEGKE